MTQSSVLSGNRARKPPIRRRSSSYAGSYRALAAATTFRPPVVLVDIDMQ